jgi:hypothetical protein
MNSFERASWIVLSILGSFATGAWKIHQFSVPRHDRNPNPATHTELYYVPPDEAVANSLIEPSEASASTPSIARRTKSTASNSPNSRPAELFLDLGNIIPPESVGETDSPSSLDPATDAVTENDSVLGDDTHSEVPQRDSQEEVSTKKQSRWKRILPWRWRGSKRSNTPKAVTK